MSAESEAVLLELRLVDVRVAVDALLAAAAADKDAAIADDDAAAAAAVSAGGNVLRAVAAAAVLDAAAPPAFPLLAAGEADAAPPVFPLFPELPVLPDPLPLALPPPLFPVLLLPPLFPALLLPPPPLLEEEPLLVVLEAGVEFCVVVGVEVEAGDDELVDEAPPPPMMLPIPLMILPTTCLRSSSESARLEFLFCTLTKEGCCSWRPLCAFRLVVD